MAKATFYRKTSIREFFHRLLFTFALLLASGCIRLTGSAGYWKQGSEGDQPESRQASFDTNDYIPGTPAPGSITKGNS